MDFPYFIKEHLQISASDEASLKKKKKHLAVDPPQSWPWKQNGTTVVPAVMILEVVNKWRSLLQVNILKKRS